MAKRKVCTCTKENEEHCCDIHVMCEDYCGALNDPQTFEEYKAAHDHWKDHGLMHGCSHGR